MLNVKYIQPTESLYVKRIERGGFKVRFRTPENHNAHETRAAWLSGGDVYVQYKGTWYNVYGGLYGYSTTLSYRELGKDDLRAIATRITAARKSADLADYDWEERSAIRMYADSLGYDPYDEVQRILEPLADAAQQPDHDWNEAEAETAETAEELPTVLAQYLETTGQLDRGPLSESHLLNEAEWVMYQSGQDGSVAHGAHQSQIEALRHYVERLRARGVTPRRDFDD